MTGLDWFNRRSVQVVKSPKRFYERWASVMAAKAKAGPDFPPWAPAWIV
jgi:hypothetical protein